MHNDYKFTKREKIILSIFAILLSPFFATLSNVFLIYAPIVMSTPFALFFGAMTIFFFFGGLFALIALMSPH